MSFHTKIMDQKIFTVLLLFSVVSYGTAVKCYHCYDIYNTTRITVADSFLDDKFVNCAKKQKDWNSWECPRDWPVCMIMSLTSKTSHEVVRTCAVKDFCSLYVPLNGVKLETCRECDTLLCNDYTGFPVPPENSGSQFVFNINLYVNKYSLANHEDQLK